MIERYCEGKLPAAGPVGCAVEDIPLREEALGLSGRLGPALERLNFAGALEAIFQLVNHANRYIENQAPWQLAKTSDPGRLHTVLSTLVEVIRIVTIALDPFMPVVSAAIWDQVGLGATPRRFADMTRWPGVASGEPIGKRAVLFPRMESAGS